MLKLRTDILQPGMVLAKTITDDKGRTLLRQGVTLTEEYIAVLKQRGASLVFVAADAVKDIQVDSAIPDVVRQQAQQTVARSFDFVQQLAAEADSPAELVADADTAEEMQANPGLSQLQQTTDSILRELLAADSVAGLSQIRQRSHTQFGHAVNVAVVGLLIGIKLHLSLEDLLRLGEGCLLHDIGKIFFTSDLFTLNGHMASRQKLRAHSRLGYELLRSRNPDNVLVNHVALEHHERQDGLGYPRGLRSTNRIERTRFSRDNILLIAEIAAVADVYDMLSNGTAQQIPLTPNQVAATMRQLAGTFLNQEIVNVFLSMLPIYPTGMNVVVRTGRYANYRGVVLDSNSKQPERPTIRLLFNPQGGRITPIDLNLTGNTNLMIEATL